MCKNNFEKQNYAFTCIYLQVFHNYALSHVSKTN